MKIRLERAEGMAEECVSRDFESWAAAEATIKKWARTAPADGGYDKVDVEVELEPDVGIALRFDMDRTHAAPGRHLFREVNTHVRFYAGLYRPAHISEEQYLMLLDASRAVREVFTKAAAILEAAEYTPEMPVPRAGLWGAS